VTNRRFAEAERILERIKLKIQETEWNKGYFQALNGILLAQKSNDDQYAFLPSIDFNNENELKKHRREFMKQATNKIHADYDRGFFSAWADYMHISTKMRKNPEAANQKSKDTTVSPEELPEP
jgi:hypothetical protein